MTLHFAYGSNMWEAQMRQRCPQSEKIGRARLRGYRWIISTAGYANVVESKGHQVEGVLFELSPSDEKSLDRYEGVAAGAYRKNVLPVRQSGRTVKALVYIAPEIQEGVPRKEYIKRINAGLADAKLSRAYIEGQVRKFIPA